MLVAVCLLSALLTSLITLNGAVAALLPLVVLLASGSGTPPSQLLMPVAFAGSAGGLLMLMSSPVNVIVSDAAAESGEGAVLLLLLRAGRHPAARRHGGDLRAARPPAAADADARLHAARPGPVRRDGRRPTTPSASEAPELVTREAGVAEVVVPPRSRLVGERVHAGHATRARPRHPGRPAARPGPRRRADAARRGRRAAAARPRGRRSTQLSRDRDVLLVDSPEARPAPGGAVGSEGDPRRARPRGAGRDAGLRPGAAGDRRPDRGRGDGAVPGRHRPAGLPVGLLADRGAGRRADPAVHRDLEPAVRPTRCPRC